MAKKEDNPQVTCPKCNKDVAVSELENGRCSECGYHIGLDRFMRDYESVKERERKEKDKEAPPAPEKKKGGGLSGWGI